MIPSEEKLKDGIALFENPLKATTAKEENVLLKLLLKASYDLNVKTIKL
jgi:hypothetical protein